MRDLKLRRCPAKEPLKRTVALHRLPLGEKTREVCLKAIMEEESQWLQNLDDVLVDVPYYLYTVEPNAEEFCWRILKASKGHAYAYLPENIRSRKRFIDYALKHSPSKSITYVPQSLWSEKLFKYFVGECSGNLKRVPKKYRTRKVCLASTNNGLYPSSLRCIKPKYFDHELCLNLVNNCVHYDKEIMDYIPDHIKNDEIFTRDLLLLDERNRVFL